MILHGRKKIITEITSDELIDKRMLIKLLNTTRTTHLVNKQDIDYLINYKNGIQPILYKAKLVRPEINNKVVINHAQMITRMITGYFLGTPIQYIQSSADGKEDIDNLNKFVAYEDKQSVDYEIGEYQSICGTAYRIIYSDGEMADEVPFEDKALNPSTTYVVYENNIAEKPVLGVTYYTLINSDGVDVGTKIYAYTNFGMYEIITDSSDGMVYEDSIFNFTPYNVGGIPIVEYPNNMWRLGDWELELDIMNAINDLQSGRLDDIDQIVQSLIVFVNADINQEVYDEMRASGIVMLNNKNGLGTDVKTVDTSLEQSGLNMFSEELERYLYAMIGIPDRNNRSGGGGDTGQAVELRDGWADLEIVARNKESVFKKSEKRSLKIMLTIMANKLGTKLSPLEVDIKFSRNKNNNLLVKTQGLQNLLASKILEPSDCLTIVDMVSDDVAYTKRGEAFWGEAFAGKVQAEVGAEMSKVSLETAKNPPEPVDATNVAPKKVEDK